MREEMISGEAGLTLTWLGERFGVEEEGASEWERRRRDCLGVRTEDRGGMIGAVAEFLIMTGKVSDLSAGTGRKAG